MDSGGRMEQIVVIREINEKMEFLGQASMSCSLGRKKVIQRRIVTVPRGEKTVEDKEEKRIGWKYLQAKNFRKILPCKDN